MDISTTTIELPESFDASSYSEIPWGAQTLFNDSTPELEAMEELIRKSLEKRLGKPVVSRDVLTQRFGLRNIGKSEADIMMGRLLIR